MTLLKALNLLKNKIKFEAVIIGKGVLKKKLSNYITNNKLDNFVKLKNFVDNPFPLIKQTDLFVLSSKYEGLPNVLLEALVLKKFIISSNCSTGPKEILLNGKGGYLYNVENYKQLTEKIIFYNENKKKSLKLLDHSYKCLKRFDFKDNLFKYYKLVKSL